MAVAVPSGPAMGEIGSNICWAKVVNRVALQSGKLLAQVQATSAGKIDMRDIPRILLVR